MQATPLCRKCALRQAENTVRLASADHSVRERVIRETQAYIETAPLTQTPASFSRPVYRIVSSASGVADPYAAIKNETNSIALSMLPRLRKLIATSADPLDAALHAAVAGNIIDLGIGHPFDIEKDVDVLMRTSFALNSVNNFRDTLVAGRNLLYICDNAGEIAFDRLLVEELLRRGLRVTCAVKSGPVINDATMEDAVQTGLTDVARVITTGSDDIGIDWRRVSDEFLTEFHNSQIVLAKGHGNFETCHDRQGPLYFLLKAKCELVASELGVKLGDIVFTKGAQ